MSLGIATASGCTEVHLVGEKSRFDRMASIDTFNEVSSLLSLPYNICVYVYIILLLLLCYIISKYIYNYTQYVIPILILITYL